jgi:hypothetical protein
MITETALNGYLGKHISAICTVGYTSNSDNHCAHFVSHALGYQFGATCRLMASGSGTPGSIRVQELFARCLEVGQWDQMPASLLSGLVFITNAANVHLRSRTMDNVPRKHVGIFFGAHHNIWHYSNQDRKVVCQTPAQFSLHYGAPDNAMFWGRVL